MSKQVITLSDRAAERVKEIISNAKDTIVGVRVGVATGGCAGMSYVMEYAKKANPNDEIIEDKGVKVLIDPKAIMYLLGTEMDYKKEEMEADEHIQLLESIVSNTDYYAYESFSNISSKVAPSEHREFVKPKGSHSILPAMVSQPLKPREWRNTPAAQKAVDEKWMTLWKRKAWDTTKPRTMEHVRSMYKRMNNGKGRTVHFAHLDELCVNKHSETGQVTYKGRIVIRGNRVFDEYGYAAIFSEISSSGSQAITANFVDAIARLPGCSGMESDAQSAYTQAPLDENDTHVWVILPDHKIDNKHRQNL